MKLDIIRIGNSQGIRLPKAVIEQAGFGAAVELEFTPEGVMLKPVNSPRQGWAEMFAADPDDGSSEPWPDSVSAQADKDWTW